MVAFILQILIMLSLGAMLYVVGKTLPRIDDTVPKELVFTEHWVLQKIERVDKRIKTSSEKFLRRLGVLLLKWENKVNKKVTRLKEEAARGSEPIAIVEEKREEIIAHITPEAEEALELPKPTKRTHKPRVKKMEDPESEGLYS